jgi:hypothetical protein
VVDLFIDILVLVIFLKIIYLEPCNNTVTAYLIVGESSTLNDNKIHPGICVLASSW